jgi:hypothetical protein
MMQSDFRTKNMKRKICLILLMGSAGLTATAQKYRPVISTGTAFNYTFHLHGQQSNFVLTVKNLTDTLLLNWTIRGLAGGNYQVFPTAFQQARNMNWAQPEPGITVPLRSQTFCMISKAAFNDLLQKHRFTYDSTVYEWKDDSKEKPLMLNNQELDVLHVTAQNETTEFWILNNPDFPMICQIRGNPLGIDVTLNSIQSP